MPERLEPLPAAGLVPPPTGQATQGDGPLRRDADHSADSPGTDFARWAARQYGQVIGPVNLALGGASRSALAQRTSLSRSAVHSVLEGTGWPQFQTVVRLAACSGVELFGLMARDLVTDGPGLPPEEQALLLAYRRLSPTQRRGLLDQAVSTVHDSVDHLLEASTH